MAGSDPYTPVKRDRFLWLEEIHRNPGPVDNSIGNYETLQVMGVTNSYNIYIYNPYFTTC